MYSNGKFSQTLFEQLRAATGLSRTEYAEALGITKQAYEKMIRGQKYINRRVFLKAFDLSGWTTEKLIAELRKRP